MKAISSIILLICVIVFNSCETNKKSKQPEYKNRLDIPVVVNTNSHIPIDSNRIKNFFNSYPQLKSYDSILSDLYHRNGFNYIWFDKAGLIEFAYSFYNKVNLIEDEGVFTKFPYFDKLEGVFNDETENLLSNPETEFMLSSLFIFYVDKIYSGIDPEKTKAIGWLLPRKQISYTVLLDSTLLVQDLLHKNEQALFYQYYLLADMLKNTGRLKKEEAGGVLKLLLNLSLSNQEIRQLPFYKYETSFILQEIWR